ncbi:SGNH/GDSL hydrolase family protein [Marinobacteraceae bacterium S3BR75-40.1]
MFIRSGFIRLTLFLLVFVASAAQAANYSNIYIFGDSLSDNGNLKAITQNPAIPERFTNGPVAVEVLGASLGFSVTPSLHLLPPEVVNGQYGNNYAIAGAIAIDADGDETTPDTNLPTQVNAFLQLHGGQAPADALYVVMIGGNDIYDAQDIVIDGTWGAGIEADQRLKAATDSVKRQLGKLVASGAQHILVVNAPDIGATPLTDIKKAQVLAGADSLRDLFVGQTLVPYTRTLSQIYNLRLAISVAEVELASGVDIKEANLLAFLDDSIANRDEYGYENVTDACIFLQTQGGAPNPGCNFSTWLFFDEIHPTAVTHQRAAQTLLEALQ